MKLTKQFLESKNACPEAMEWYKEKNETDVAKLFGLALKEEKLDWANWAIARLMSRKQRIQYSIFAAEQVIHIFEKQYPEDKRPRKAIEAAKAVLQKNTAGNREVAYAAYAAAAAAAYAAYAAFAAYDAADAAAYAAAAADAAAYAAFAAYDAAYDAAYAAAAYAEKKKMKIKILNYGISMLLKSPKELP